jgi:DNA-binding MarR family transcriptional regulator
MNAIYFGAKRVFHGFLRITRDPFESNGITAARFDLMMVLRKAHSEEGSWHRRLWQSKLWRQLGVTPSVVSRMVKGLEGLGLIRREVSNRDRRQREVLLTEKGRQCVREAYRMTVRWVLRFVCEVISCGKGRDLDAWFHHMLMLEGYMDRLRRHSRDGATLYYPWGHPDD